MRIYCAISYLIIYNPSNINSFINIYLLFSNRLQLEMLLAALVPKDLVPVVSVLMMGMNVCLVNLETVETEDLRFLCIPFQIINSLKV